MPNWCDNTLTIEGDCEGAKFLMAAFRNEDPFQAIYPCPKELDHPDAHRFGGTPEEKANQIVKRRELNDKYGYESGYDWRCGEWGTKWDVDADIMNEGNAGLPYMEVCFASAWSPPIELYRYINRVYPSVRLSWTYEEPGVGFAGDGGCEGDLFEDNVRDFLYDEEDVNCAPDSYVGSATILPLPGGAK